LYQVHKYISFTYQRNIKLLVKTTYHKALTKTRNSWQQCINSSVQTCYSSGQHRRHVCFYFRLVFSRRAHQVPNRV